MTISIHKIIYLKLEHSCIGGHLFKTNRNVNQFLSIL